MIEVGKLQLSKQHNIQINACQMYLNVETLSDIANPDGRTINNRFIEGNKPLSSSSTFKWSNQPLPSPEAWDLWMLIIRQVFHISKTNLIPIHHQLKLWLVPYPLI